MGGLLSVSAKDALETVAKANTSFALSVYELLCKEEGNLFFSPLSLEVILALTYTGAKGKTAEQMATALHLPQNRKVILAGFHALIEAFKSTSVMTVNLANSVFAQKGCSIRSDFRSVAEKSFMAAAQELDFQKHPEEARKVMNSWVEEHTKGKISEIIASGVLSDTTQLVLANAVYFKGKWKLPFVARCTAKAKFMINTKEHCQVQMMNQKEDFRYGELKDLNTKVLEMPYQGDRVSLLILLPDEVDGIKQLEVKLPKLDLAAILKSLQMEEVCLSLPKFKLDHTSDMVPSLKQLGIKNVFDFKSSDLTGIAETKEPLVVNNVVQKAFIEVDELGSEAGAATVSSGNVGAGPGSHPKVFRADHPFFFALVERSTATPLFIGRFSKP